MENRYKINYDIKTSTVNNIKFKQGDADSSVLEISLIDSGLPVVITGEVIEFRFLKSDGTVVFQGIDSGVSIIDALTGNIQCILKTNTLSAPGIVKCDIYRTLDGKGLTTQSFNFTVESSIGADGILSVNYISSIESKIVEWQAEYDAHAAEYHTYAAEYDTFKTVMIDASNVAALQNNININTAQIKDTVQVNVKQFGAIGDGINDDTQAINDAIAYSQTLIKPLILFPAAVGYRVTSGIVIPFNTHVEMVGYILYDGVNDKTCLTIGSSTTLTFDTDLNLRVKNKNASTWALDTCIGIKIINANACNINVKYTSSFTIGVQFSGNNGGLVYNNVTLGYIFNNKYGVDLINEGTGWCNENLFFGGRFGLTSTTNASQNRYGVRITSKTTYYNNNNTFLKPSFELGQSYTSGEAIPVLIEFGNQNSFSRFRNENNNAITARITNNSTENKFESGFGTITVDDKSLYPFTQLKQARTQLMDEANNLIFSSGPLHKLACYYDDTTINVPNVHAIHSANDSVYKNSASFTLNKDYLESYYGIGVFVKTKNCKRFVVRKDCEQSNGGRIGVRCYDVNDVLLTSAGINHPYVQGSISNVFSYTTNYGGTYSTGSDSYGDTYFTVNDDVDYVVIILNKGTAVLRIRSFSVFAVDEQSCATWTGYEEIIKSCNLGTKPPIAGTWQMGRKILNSTPTVGQPKGWICTVAGTPGTWVSEGNL